MKRIEMSIEEIHEVTLAILKKIDAIAEEIGIRYFMAYGSLIGVVRHRGFIPWDDDLDMMIMKNFLHTLKSTNRNLCHTRFLTTVTMLVIHI